jgi:hypothetical protein
VRWRWKITCSCVSSSLLTLPARCRVLENCRIFKVLKNIASPGLFFQVYFGAFVTLLDAPCLWKRIERDILAQYDALEKAAEKKAQLKVLAQLAQEAADELRARKLAKQGGVVFSLSSSLIEDGPSDASNAAADVDNLAEKNSLSEDKRGYSISGKAKVRRLLQATPHATRTGSLTLTPVVVGTGLQDHSCPQQRGKRGGDL